MDISRGEAAGVVGGGLVFGAMAAIAPHPVLIVGAVAMTGYGALALFVPRLREDVTPMKFLPQSERESQFATVAGVLLLFLGLFAGSGTFAGLGALVTALAVIAWVAAARRARVTPTGESAQR